MAVCDRETAIIEFERFLDEMDIDSDLSSMDSEDKAQFEKLKSRVIRAIEKGQVMINDKGEAVLRPIRSEIEGAETLTFHERTGASLMASDGKKQDQNVAKTYAVMSDMCRTHPSVFSKMKGSDIKVAEAIFALLMD